MTLSKSLLSRLRAISAREYTNNPKVSRHYKDGFTHGWLLALDEAEKKAKQSLTKRLFGSEQ